MQLPPISIENILKDACPEIRLGVLLMKVNIAPSGEPLQRVIESTLSEKSVQLGTEDISKIPSLNATRQAYKTLGKDPSRYRPSAEALLRRAVKGKGLYQVNNVVDALNLVSVQSGFSIGGYDFEKIKGAIQLGRGEANEPYQAIGRGELNIEGLPVLRDETSAFGSPTSDSIRTMVTQETKVFLSIVFGFGKNEGLENVVADLEDLLINHAAGSEVFFEIMEA